jgi:uracil-DNA glycosylase
MASGIHWTPEALHEVELLRWWGRVGVTHTLDEVGHDRFAADPARDDGDDVASDSRNTNERPAGPPTDIRSREIHGRGGRVSDAVELSAREIARQAQDLDALRDAMEKFDGCALRHTATQLVFADGAPGSRVMFVGEAPGESEDRIGRPFVGRAGKLLDSMLGTIGLNRQCVYIANIVPWRPPGNRTPTPQETQVCLPFIERQIELAGPEFLVCLGGSAARTLLGVQGIMRARGSWRAFAPRTGPKIQAFAMLHPAFLLRQPGSKRYAWSDLRALEHTLATP